MKVFMVLSAVLAVAVAAPTNDESSTFRKLFSNCLNSEDTVTCLTIKGITAMNRAARSANIEILPGVSFQRDSTASARSGKAISENEIIESLPAESSERSNRLYDMAVNSFATFLDSHTMEVKFPQESTQEVARAIEEGRGKLKKVAGPLLLAFGAKLIALIPLFIGGLIFLAFKALVVSKIAFVLAALLGLQKFGTAAGGLNLLGKVVGGGFSSGGLPGTWSSAALGSQYPYARTYENAQDMAYSAYSGEVPAEQQ